MCRTILLAALSLCFASTLIAQEKKTDWKFKSSKATAALKNYGREITGLNKKGEAALQKLNDGYKKKVKEERLELILELEKVLNEATKDGRLDEAVKIRDAIKALHGGAKPPGTPALLAFGGDVKQSGPMARIPRDALRYKGHHYKFFANPMTWHVARRYCESLGGHLLRIESAAEHAFVLQAIKKGGLVKNMWIDGSDAVTEGQWFFRNGKKMSFAKWRQGEPDNHQGHQHTAHIGPKGLWWDTYGTARTPFICEWDK